MEMTKVQRHIDQYFVSEMEYQGTPGDGMLAWLDEKQIGCWWKADNVTIEPAEGGMFYISWKPEEQEENAALLGIVSKVDTENHEIALSRVLYLSPRRRYTNIHFTIKFQQQREGYSKLLIIQQHQFTGQVQADYQEQLQATWPALLQLFCSFFVRQ
jgi:hypothetical protein